MRDLIFLHHKISNNDQSADKATVKKNVKREMKNLGLIGDGAYLDLVSIHSPLTDKERRMNSYKALLELQEEGIVKAVGVCNYGVSALSKSLQILSNGEVFVFTNTIYYTYICLTYRTFL